MITSLIYGLVIVCKVAIEDLYKAEAQSSQRRVLEAEENITTLTSLTASLR
jgi:hypothetical protein